MGEVISLGQMDPLPEAEFFAYPIEYAACQQFVDDETIVTVTEAVRTAALNLSPGEVEATLPLIALVSSKESTPSNNPQNFMFIKPYINRDNTIAAGDENLRALRALIASKYLSTAIAESIVEYALDDAHMRQHGRPPRRHSFNEQLERAMLQRYLVLHPPHVGTPNLSDTPRLLAE